ncbi:fibronectin type III domain-containing protein [Streptobacillus moniliformis]|uniref:fibronectin type III domain-containing protein n=1 Tax=Streptobacillus moniliformis TaxID=34105 RepID=UPI0007E421DF|nr:fibronectin type III domain-containing protein [Streptobacillus moniliformis]
MVSKEYFTKTFKAENNIKHELKIFNITKETELTTALRSSSLSINKNLKKNNTLTPNSVSLVFDNKIDVQVIEKEDLIKIVDVFYDTELTIFLGKVYELTERLDSNKQNILNITIKDETVKGYETKFYEDTTYINKWYYNSSDKENSILWILAKKLGFEDNKIEIEEIKYSSGEYISNSVIKINKGSTVIKELGELVASISGNIYVKSNGTLKITSLLNQSDTNIIDYTLSIEKGNILKYIETKENTPKEDMVVIDYTEYKNLERQPIFILMGQNGDNARDLANINLKPNTPKKDIYWKISYITENVSNIDKNNLEIKAYYFEDEKTKKYFDFKDYEIDFDKKTLRLWNDKDKEVFIEKFKIYGIPIKELKDNTVKYSEVKKDNELDYNILNIKNKYINDNRLAVEISKYKYFSNCRKVNTYKLVCNSIPFIELEDVIYLEYEKIKRQVQVVSISQKHNETELELIDYVVFKEKPINIKSYKTNNFDSSVINSNVKYGNIELDPQSPPIPTNLTAISDLLAVSLKWMPPLNYKEIKGYYLYITNNENSLENRIFVGNVDNYYAKLPLGEYNFRLKTVNLKGIESDFTDYVKAKTLQIGAKELLLDDVLDKTNDDKLTIKDNGITAHKIGASVIKAHHIQSNSIRTEHLIADTVTLEKLKFSNENGIERINVGTEEKPSYKLRLNGNIDFTDNVNIKGKITGNNAVVLQDEENKKSSRKIELTKYGIDLFEYDTKNENWSKTLGIRKIKSGIFNYNETTKNQWLDVRDFQEQEWNNIDLKVSLQAFNVRNNTRRVFAEIIRNQNDKHLFKIKVGGISTVPIKEDFLKDEFNVPTKEQINTNEDIILYERIFTTYNKIKVELPTHLDIKYVYWHDGKASSDYKVEKLRKLKIYPSISYRKIGSKEWVEEIQYNEIYIDTATSELDKFEIRLQIKSEPLKFNYAVGMVAYELETYSNVPMSMDNKNNWRGHLTGVYDFYAVTRNEEIKKVFTYNPKLKDDEYHVVSYPENNSGIIARVSKTQRHSTGNIEVKLKNLTTEEYTIGAWDNDNYYYRPYVNLNYVPWGSDDATSINHSAYTTLLFLENMVEVRRGGKFANYICIDKYYKGNNEYKQWILMDSENPIPYLFYEVKAQDIPLLDGAWWRNDWKGSGISYSDRKINIQLSQEKTQDIEGGTAIWTATEY